MSNTINIRRLEMHLHLPANLAGGITVPSHLETISKSAPGHTKVLADGTHVAGEDPRTDHAAVIDHASGLMWAVESMGDPKDADDGISQAECVQRCTELRLLGHGDWRLPTRAELVGLIDDTRHEPAIDTSLFPRVKPRWHWTSTPAAWSASSAWGVSFYLGLVDYSHRSVSGFALAVRRAGQ
ncbi:DUF1566 domain-containing protein [Pseudoxanthomonas winnipegensis]|nr:DUF1566 domain-containing protein [Pseudoxanthomonas winnipegensis]